MPSWLLRSSWLCLGFAAGCVQVLGVSSDPELVVSEEDGGSLRMTDTGRWRCLDGDLSVPPDPVGASVTVRVQACDFLNSCITPVTGLRARVCGRRDVSCTNPFSTDITDREGELVFEAQTGISGFDGYLEVTAPTHPCTDEEVFGETSELLCSLVPECDPEQPDEACQVPTYVKSLLFFNPPIRQEPAAPLQLPMLSASGLPQVVRAAGVEPDPSTGNLFITAFDCDGNMASGVTYAIQDHEDVVTQLYVDSGAVSDTVLQTDESGVGGFVGVPPGFAEVTAYNENLDRIGEVGVIVAPFTMTYAALVPSE